MELLPPKVTGLAVDASAGAMDGIVDGISVNVTVGGRAVVVAPVGGVVD